MPFASGSLRHFVPPFAALLEPFWGFGYAVVIPCRRGIPACRIPSFRIYFFSKKNGGDKRDCRSPPAHCVTLCRLSLRSSNPFGVSGMPLSSPAGVVFPPAESHPSAFIFLAKKMAEREGFEPSVEFPLRRFSKPLLSATQPPLRLLKRYALK